MASSTFPLEISVTEASALAQPGPDQALILDVREPAELAICQIIGAEHIPMRQVPTQVSTLPRDRHLLVLCHHGVRSLSVTQFLRAQGFTAASSIAGGIEAWAEQLDPAMARY
ncbi:MAG: rhodanese-like domain-containing protein [Opitutaceae bacterium]